jgi:hypothetical protein
MPDPVKSPGLTITLATDYGPAGLPPGVRSITLSGCGTHTTNGVVAV